MTERKILLIGRHGVAPQKPEGGSEDWLVPESVADLYIEGLQMQDEILEIGASPNTTSVRRTNKDRTEDTALARIAGVFGMFPDVRTIRSAAGVFYGRVPPKSREDLARYVGLKDVEVIRDDRFNIGACSLKAYKENGAAWMLNDYLARPNASEQCGESIETFNSQMARNKAGLVEYLTEVVEGDTQFGNLITHATCIELPWMLVVNSGRDTPIERIEDIGGASSMEEYGKLTIDRTEGGLYTAKFELKGQKHKVDLQKLLG
jgi:hypothetical protein